MLSAATKGAVNRTLTEAGGARADDRRHRGADPRPARLVRAPGPAPAAHDRHRPRLHARASSRWPGPSCSRRLARGGPAAGQRRAGLPARPAAGRARHQRGQRRRGRLPRRAAAERLRLPRAPRSTSGCRAPTRPVDRVGHPHARHPPASTSSRSCAAAAPAPTSPPSTTKRWPGPSRACPVPVLTGIGHEIDTSVADEVAHTAAKTPTACAQLLVGAGRRRRRRARRRAGRPSPGRRGAGVGRHDERLVAPRAATSPRGARWRSTAAPPGSTRVADRARRASLAGLDAAGRAARRPPRPHHRRRPLAPARRRGAGRRRRAPGRPPGPTRRWPTPSGRWPRLEARAARPRPRAHAGPGLVDHPRTRRPGVRSPADVAAGDALVTTVLAERRGPLYGGRRWLTTRPTDRLRRRPRRARGDPRRDRGRRRRRRRARRHACAGRRAAAGVPRPHHRGQGRGHPDRRRARARHPPRPTTTIEPRSPAASYDARAMTRPSSPSRRASSRWPSGSRTASTRSSPPSARAGPS